MMDKILMEDELRSNGVTDVVEKSEKKFVVNVNTDDVFVLIAIGIICWTVLEIVRMVWG